MKKNNKKKKKKYYYHFRRRGGGGAISYDPDAQILFNEVVDMPDDYKSAYNTFILDLKAAGIWSKGIGAFTNIPCSDDELAMTNLFDPTGSKAVCKGSSDTGIKNFMACPYINELVLDGVLEISTFVNLPINPSTDFTSGVTAVEIVTTNHTSANLFDFGAYTNGSNTFSVQHRNNAGSMNGQLYSTSGNGFVSGANTTTQYDVFVYKTDESTITESRKNGVSIDSNAGSSGTKPNNNIVWGDTYNPSNPPTWLKRPKRASALMFFDYLDGTEVSALETAIDTFQANMNRPTNNNGTAPTQQIVVEGNSLMRYYNQRTFRKIQLARPKAYEHYHSFAISGRTTTQMLAAVAQMNTQYDGSLDFNWALFWEITNDLDAGVNEATAKSNAQSWISTVDGYGYDKVFCATMVARTSAGNGLGLSKTDWYLLFDSINEDIKDNPSSYGGNVIALDHPNLWQPRSNYASDAEFVTAIDAILANTTYYNADQIHLTEAGFDLVASIMSNIINA